MSLSVLLSVSSLSLTTIVLQHSPEDTRATEPTPASSTTPTTTTSSSSILKVPTTSKPTTASSSSSSSSPTTSEVTTRRAERKLYRSSTITSPAIPTSPSSTSTVTPTTTTVVRHVAWLEPRLRSVMPRCPRGKEDNQVWWEESALLILNIVYCCESVIWEFHWSSSLIVPCPNCAIITG